MRRVLGGFELTCIGVNAIVGSGIYMFPGALSAALGWGAIPAWVATGALCLPIALTFAALGGMDDRTGGPVRYAELAFGKGPSFLVGWSAWVTSVLSWAAVASALPAFLRVFVPWVEPGARSSAVTAALIALLALLNVLGVKPGVRLTAALTVGKLVPLVVFVAVGLFAVEARHFAAPPDSAWRDAPALGLKMMFAYQGFEVVGVAAGEAKDPRRAVPRAVVASILLATVLYVLVEVVIVGVGGKATDAALPDAARAFLGSGGAALLAAGALVSMLGFNAGTAFSTPRYLLALAEERLIPPLFARADPRFETPSAAIALTALCALSLSFVLDFGRLVDLSVLAVLVQYFATSAALVRLGRGSGAKLLGAVSAVISVVFALKSKTAEFVVLGAVLALGVVIALATRAVLRRSA